VLLIVYHPADNELYCKEIGEYVRSTLNVFQQPFRVVFKKATDKFNTDYFDSIRQHAKVSQSRISFQQREQFFSNLLPVRKLPDLSHASTTYTNVEDIREIIRGDHTPFCVVGDRIFTFDDLRSDECALRTVCDRDIETITADEWLGGDPERHTDYVFLLNQLLGSMQWQAGLKYNRDFGRTYFPRENDTDLEFRRSWFNARTQQRSERMVAKYYEYGINKFWRHLASHLSFVCVNDTWFLRIVPKYFFTTDGKTPCESELVGPYTTRLKAMEHNLQVLNHVLFWADTFAHDKDNISYYCDHRIILSIDRTPMTSIADFAIIDDPATFEEKEQPAQLALFDAPSEDADD
jgi:hypothetical protein